MSGVRRYSLATEQCASPGSYPEAQLSFVEHADEASGEGHVRVLRLTGALEDGRAASFVDPEHPGADRDTRHTTPTAVVQTHVERQGSLG